VSVNLVAGPLNRASNEENWKGKHDQMKTETEGGGAKVNDDGGKVNDYGLEVEDGSSMLEVNDGVLRARG
jgi:hypothetical protein